LWLNLLVISALLRGSYRRYPFVFAYALALLVSTVVEIALQAAPRTVQDGFYWIDEVILDVLLFCLVIAFIDEAARHSKQKIVERHWLVLAGALICALSFAINRTSHFNRQMTQVSLYLNIYLAILDLILWGLLLTARPPNRPLMLLSGGLGLQLTGAIMGQQLLQFSHRLFWTGTLLEVTTSFLGLYIWWRALRTAPAPKTVPA